MADPFSQVPKTEGGWTCCQCDTHNLHTSKKCKVCGEDHLKCNLRTLFLYSAAPSSQAAAAPKCDRMVVLLPVRTHGQSKSGSRPVPLLWS
ncbi:hypothetical protein ASPCAL03004 [Aspergillus calidoustus]|uniref:RanBP2-type domain-containing protein n=1 Tax=Aspergillus calidoustus TaxID=454130 RepID=A0A0U5GP92_ASPCI|nr:hypothetical protein ASPCAL03004 [Aspergillus calidoustus]